MSHFAKYFLLFMVIAALALPMAASNVTISGFVTFASLDGSAQDDDHTVNGVFTVNGDLTVLGSIVCVDTSGTGCPMQFVVSGNVELGSGSLIVAENNSKTGSGGNISFVAGGNFAMDPSTSSQNGAVLSSAQTNDSGNGAGGSVTINTGGTFTQGNGSLITTASKNSTAGAVSITSGGVATLGGQLLATPSRTLSSTYTTGTIVTGGGNSAAGGPITIKANTHTEPGLVVSSTAIIASQGNNGGAATVLLEGRD